MESKMTDTPIEFLRALEKAKRERDLSAQMIKHYTDDWVKAQRKYIEMLEFIGDRCDECYGLGKDPANPNLPCPFCKRRK